MPENEGTLNAGESSASVGTPPPGSSSPANPGTPSGDLSGIGNRPEYSRASDATPSLTMRSVTPPGAKRAVGKFGDIESMIANEGQEIPLQRSAESSNVVQEPVNEKPLEGVTEPLSEPKTPTEEVEVDIPDERFDKHPRFQQLLAEAKAAREEASQSKAAMQRFEQWQREQQVQTQAQADAQVLAKFESDLRESVAAELGVDPNDPAAKPYIDRVVTVEKKLKQTELTEARAAVTLKEQQDQYATEEAVKAIRKDNPIIDTAFDVTIPGANGPVKGTIEELLRVQTAHLPAPSRELAMRTHAGIIADIEQRAYKRGLSDHAAKLAADSKKAGPVVSNRGGGGTQATQPAGTQSQPKQSGSKFFGTVKID